MSSEQLKTSLRHTHAYIEAYGVELLENVEMLFRQALARVDEGAMKSTQTDVTVNFDEPAVQPTPPEPVPRPTQTAPSRHEESSVAQETTLETLANWHFHLPAIVAGVAVAAILLRGWLS